MTPPPQPQQSRGRERRARDEAWKWEAEAARLREALGEIVAAKNTRIVCTLHGGDSETDDCCGCGIALDAESKMRAIAAAALTGEQR